MTDLPNAAAILTGIGELPESTHSVSGAADAAAPAPAAAGRSDLDTKGTPFDPAMHEADRAGVPRRKSDGSWQLKRGNGARKAAGKSLLNLFGLGGDKPAKAPPVAAAPQPQSAPAPAPSVSQRIDASEAPAGSSGGASPGAQGQEVDGVPDASRPIDDYDGTAESLVHGQFAVAELLLGPAWQADKPEHTKWVNAWRRVLFHYQLPVIGPLLELCILAVSSITKRRGDEETRSRLSGVFRWLTGGSFRAPKPAQRVEAQS